MNSTELQPSYSQTSFPVLTITVIGIILTVSFLLSYYVFVIKCCLNRHSNSDIIQRLSRLPRSRKLGLHQSAIQAIPILKYFKADNSSHECSVCLYEFEEEERIRMLPNCFHVFHIDCIDTWLQTHSNCPLCRADVTCCTPPIHNMHDDDDHDAVVIDVREDNYSNDHKKLNYKGSSLGDECIDFSRVKDHEEFVVEPIRRSFSMGSLSERRLYATVQEILRHNLHFKGEGSSMG